MNDQLSTLDDFARHSAIPRKVLLYLHRQQFIQDPPSQDDLLGLRLLEQVWGNKEILRPHRHPPPCGSAAQSPAPAPPARLPWRPAR